MNRANLFAEAIQASIVDSENTAKNLAALLQLIRNNDRSDAEVLLAQIKSLLSGNSQALEILDKINAHSSDDGVRFAKVLANDPSATQQLALWVGISGASRTYPDEAVEFVEGSRKAGTDLLKLFELARQVQDSLDGDILLRKEWQDAVIPSLLNEILNSSDLLALTASVAIGVNIPDQWKLAEFWISEWFRNSPKVPDDENILFVSQRDEYQPAAVNPLALRVARLQFIDDLNKGRNQADIRTFSRWLTQQIFDDEPLVKLKPECAFAAGSLIVALGAQQGVEIREDGQVVSPDADVFWKEEIESTLESIVINSERFSNPSSWQGQPTRTREIVEGCPGWYSKPIIFNLRSRAKRRLSERFESLKITITKQAQKLKAEISFSLNVESIAGIPLPDLRPSFPIIANEISGNDNSLRKMYRDELEKIDAETTLLAKEDTIAQDVSEESQKSRRRFEARLISPFAQPVLVEIVRDYLSEIDRDESQKLPLLWTYLCNQLPKQSLNFKVASDRWESLENQPEWINAINQVAPTEIDALKAWVKLELWDGLRGRLSYFEEEDQEPANRLYAKLPSWLKQEEDPSGTVDELRPVLAALAHLGISPKQVFLETVLGRLENLLGRDDLESSLKSLLAATRIEIGLSLLIEQVKPSSAFGFEQLKATQEKLGQWAIIALESQNAWENRAGINMLTLLSRLAGVTSDPFLIEVLNNTMRKTVRGQEIVAYAVDVLLGDGKGLISGLPLALVAFDLERFMRDSTYAISSIKQPIWFQKLQNLSVSDSANNLIEELTERLANTKSQLFQDFSQNGAEAGKNLILGILQAKLIEFQFERQLSIEPLRRTKSQLKQTVLLQQLEGLRNSLRSAFCGEQILLNGIKTDPTEVVLVSGTVAVGDKWTIEINKKRIEYIATESSIANVIDGLSKAWNPSIRDISPSKGSSIFAIQTSPYLVFRRFGEGSLSVEVSTTSTGGSIKKISQATEVVASVVERPAWWKTSYWFQVSTLNEEVVEDDGQPPFLLFQWSASYNNRVDAFLLAKAADLGASLPVLPKYRIPIGEDAGIRYTVEDLYSQDIDGYYEDEFPDISWKEAQTRLEETIVELEKTEDKYKKVLSDGNNDARLDEIIDLLKKPLIFATADYREQVNAAIANVRRAEADLEVAERESLATEFEMFASQLIYEAASIEVERQKTLQEIQSKNNEIIKLEGDIAKIIEEQKNKGVSIEERKKEIIKLTVDQLQLRKEVAEKARVALQNEIELLKRLLGDEKGSDTYKISVKLPDGQQGFANGQVAAIGLRVEYTVRTQLKTELDKAVAELKKVEDREREERKRQRRRKLVSAICTFIGTAVGTYFGAPALGAQIGAAIGELGNGILDNKSPGEIFVGLIDNGLSIAQAAGVDLEKELNTLSTKGAAEVSKFFDKLDLNLKPVIDSLPTVLNEGLVKEGFAALGLEAVPELVDLLGQSYDDLKKDIKNSPKLGTALKNAGIIGSDGKPPIQFTDADDLVKKLGEVGGNLFSRTRDNSSQIKVLAQTIGKRVEELKDDPDELRDAGIKLGQLLISQISREAAKYQRDAISNWVQKNKELKVAWEQIEEEANVLVEELFQNSKARTDALANIRMAFLDPATLQAKIQGLLDPWQTRLNEKLDGITKTAQGSSSRESAGDAARASVRAFEASIQRFERDLVPWLKGDSPERRALLKDLETKLDEDFKKVKELEELQIEEVKNKLEAASADDLIDIARGELESAKLKSKIVEIQVTQVSLQSRVAELTKVQSVKREEAEKNSYNAAVQRNTAAKGKVRAARYELESKTALLEAAKRRGAEASRIRGALNQPSLLSLIATDTSTKSIRDQYAFSLETAFSAYRQLKRYYRSAEANQVPQLKIPTPSNDSSWSALLKNWQDEGTRDILKSIDPQEPTPIEWDFTPEQIAALFTPKGFSIVNGPNISESPLLFRTSSASLLKELNEQVGKENSFLNLLFIIDFEPTLESAMNSGEISSEWVKILKEQGIPIFKTGNLFLKDNHRKDVWHIADSVNFSKQYTIVKNDQNTRVTTDDKFAVYSRSLWFQEFERHGIDLSTEIKVSGAEPNWKIIDKRERNVSVSTLNEDRQLDELWRISSKSINDFIGYFVTLTGERNVLEIRRRQDPPEISRSPLPDAYYNEINPARAKTGSIIAVLFEATIWGTSQQISENDYPIEVIHLGDHWLSSKYVELHRSRPRKLSNSRVTFLDAGTSPGEYLSKVQKDADTNGDPSPLIVPGTPLSGTTVIQLRTKGTSQPEFRKLKMTIYYKYFTPR